jgi:hypothetical protein
MTQKPLDFWGYLIIITLFTFLSYAGYLSYKSIDWNVLKRLEASPLNLPAPITPTISSPSSTLKK